MNEDKIPTSSLEHILETLLTREIPAAYWLIERFALAMSAILLASCLLTVLRVRAMTGNYSMQSMGSVEASPMQVIAKFFASVFLGSFGLGQAVISNTLLLGNFEPYSVDVLRSISCSINDAAGCLHYELGVFSDGSWAKASINETFLEFFTGVVTLVGTSFYLIGWLNFSKLGNQQARTFGQCCTQIIVGALLMRPTELVEMVSGGF